jgi:hypothetical protein
MSEIKFLSLSEAVASFKAHNVAAGAAAIEVFNVKIEEFKPLWKKRIKDKIGTQSCYACMLEQYKIKATDSVSEAINDADSHVEISIFEIEVEKDGKKSKITYARITAAV